MVSAVRLSVSLYTAGTNLKLAEGYICHRVPECTRSPLAEQEDREVRVTHLAIAAAGAGWGAESERGPV
ncbi:hypothetical protein TcasGA2_TC001267 [Tribolium castaneum]|uniref:Uncharacterized protein n=1 Tax=Tribolium castaneum TaxID=7070 RepID=D6WBD1_TRICA|nr:hypothetical protein TcasGA2_TC001267 [Tribolium castaneum]